MPKHYVLSVACIPFHHLGISGGPGRDRTADTEIFSLLLYRLSYRPILVATEGLGPSWSAYETPFVTRQCGHDKIFTVERAGFEPASCVPVTHILPRDRATVRSHRPPYLTRTSCTLSPIKITLDGWGSWIRTSASQSQSLLPYQAWLCPNISFLTYIIAQLCSCVYKLFNYFRQNRRQYRTSS